MTLQFNEEEGRVLHGLIEDVSNDIVIRLDHSGFIIHASQAILQLGFDPRALLVMPHIADLAQRDHAPEVMSHVASILNGTARAQWIEFPLVAREEDGEGSVAPHRSGSWYALGVRRLTSDNGPPVGGLGLLRPIGHKHALAAELSAQATTDPLTGIANRSSFCASLARRFGRQSEPPQECEAYDTMAIFAVDRARAIYMQYGQATSDEIRWGFARFLETMTRPDQDIAVLDEERFGVILPKMTMPAAREWASDVLSTFTGLTHGSTSRAPELTASAGLARIEMSVDWTMRQAELGLVMARAGGGRQTGVCRPSAWTASGAGIERAIGQAVERASGKRPSRRW